MKLYHLKTPLVVPGDNLIDIILKSLNKRRLKLKDNDILVIATKIISTTEGRIVDPDSVKPSKLAMKLAKKYSLDPGFTELVIRESKEIFGGVTRALLTLKNNFLVGNAGIDHSNTPIGKLILWPKNPQKSAERIRDRLFNHTGKRVGIAIVDSRTTPLRMGTVGVALGVSGFKPVKDYRKKKDLYGKTMYITRQAVADDLVCAAHLLMGETSESVPIVLIRNAPVEFAEIINPKTAMIAPEGCMFMKNLRSSSHR